MAPADKHLVINELNLDLGEIDLRNWDDVLPAKLTEQLTAALQNAMKVAEAQDLPDTKSAILRTHSASVFEAFVCFLEKGVLPWHFILPKGARLENLVWEALAQEKDEGAAWLQRLRSQLAKTQVARRLAQVRHAGLGQWLQERLLQGSASAFAHLQKEYAGAEYDVLHQKIGEARWFLANKHGVAPNDLLSKALEFLMKDPSASAKAFVKDNRELSELAKTLPEKERPAAPAPTLEAEGVYVENAGLVILHPFIPMLFERTGIARDEQIVDEGRALALLHYLCTGFTDTPEYDTALAKTLCNIAWEIPVDTNVALSPDDLDQADTVLRSAIKYWDALGDTSLDSLRGTFLLRPGKLSLEADGEWHLQVEQRSFDILLDQLPWTISLLHLPWMPRNFNVHWT
jgi:hypothetical protein